MPIREEGVIAALESLDESLRAAGHKKILSNKMPTNWIGKKIAPGMIGLINHGEMPKLLTKPGRYPGFPLRNWWARSFKGTRRLSDSVIDFQGLTVVQVLQNQAAVILDPQNTIFVLKNPGFVAYCVTGSYDVLAIVDQTCLPHPVEDRVTGAILGHKFEVRMASATGSANFSTTEYVAALFLDIPVNNCAILQSGNDFKLLSSGQHYITCPNVTLRGLYTLSEDQFEKPMGVIFTRDQVPVSLTLYLKWQLDDPVKLATRGYKMPYDVFLDKAQSILTQIAACDDYSSIVKQRPIGGDGTMGSEISSQFLEAVRKQAMVELYPAALECGVTLKDLAVIDSRSSLFVASTMDKPIKGAPQAQVEAANLDRENRNKVKQEEGVLSVARIKAQAPTAETDAEAYSTVTVAVAGADSTQLEAEAEVRRLEAEARRLGAEAMRLEAEARRLAAVALTRVGSDGGS
ncbi:hypothetical protein BJY52DRAFT_1178082 [Lactarius psammicola]|nr:hypothetical protein BJY52DRAFT_1178082 [Lactarius psammicola]